MFFDPDLQIHTVNINSGRKANSRLTQVAFPHMTIIPTNRRTIQHSSPNINHQASPPPLPFRQSLLPLKFYFLWPETMLTIVLLSYLVCFGSPCSSTTQAMLVNRGHMMHKQSFYWTELGDLS